MNRTATLTLLAAMCVLGTLAVGQSPETPADQTARLQAENRLLRAQVERLQRELAEVKAQLEAARQQKPTSQAATQPAPQPQPAEYLKGEFAIGQVGQLKAARVLRVLDGKTMLVEYTLELPTTHRFRTPRSPVPGVTRPDMTAPRLVETQLVVGNCATTGIVTNRVVDFTGTFKITGTRNVGAQTVFVAEAIDDAAAKLMPLLPN